MKKLIPILCLALLTFACKKGEPNINELELKELKELKKEKKAALKELQKIISDIDEKILEKDPPKEKPAVEVVTTTLVNQEFKKYTEVQGRIVADDVVNVSSEIGGRILQLLIQEGDYVKKGQLLASTDLITLENQISELNTSLALAKTVYERQKRLWDQNIGSELQFLEAKSSKERLEKSLQTMQSQLKKKNIYAPISGIVDKEFLSQGEMASPGMPIIQILNTSRIKIVADLQESLLGSIDRGDQVEVYFPSLDLTSKHKVSMIGRTIDPTNRTFKIEMNTGSMKGKLKPNLMAQIKINDFSTKNAIVIPLDAVKEDVNGNKFVYTSFEDQGKFFAKKTLINLGQSYEGKTIITEGLKEGETIITSGGNNVTNSTLIKPIQTEG